MNTDKSASIEASEEDSARRINRDVDAIARIDAVPTLLRVLCDITGMGFAAVARVTQNTWTACAVQDDIQFGLQVGGQLDLSTTLCTEVRASRTAVVIDDASIDPKYSNHHTPRIYNIKSYISVPIVLASGDYFGNLCAIDPRPASVSEPRIVSMFNRFAELIAHHLDGEQKREQTQTALLDERVVSELREQFIAVLGHDLRNPLAAIGACGEVLQKKSAEPMYIMLGARIKTNVKRMSGLIDDVLDFARGRLGGGLGIDMQLIDDIEDCLGAVVAELQDTHPTREIIFNMGECPAVRCDRGRVQQLTSNLLANALSHGSQNSPVKFKSLATDTELVLSVWNDGAPIPQESIEKIFSPFWRGAASTKKEGLGLGLYICSQIVKAHHGHLEVTSTQQTGTQFIAHLPLGV